MNTLIRLFVLVLVGGLLFWLIGMLPLGVLFLEILRVILIVICIVFLIDTFYPFMPRRQPPL